ncbi:MAG TPA: hypothetical protein VFZ82_17435 [Methylomirabilota bacterium]|jgi:hypothetical protein|nr:hypothetical protein [Methylomirabilota bacterium]
MTQPVIDLSRHKGQFFEMLQETARSQTPGMTIGPGQDAGRNPGAGPLFFLSVYAPPAY